MKLPNFRFWQFFLFSPHESTACRISHPSCPILFTHTSCNKALSKLSTEVTIKSLNSPIETSCQRVAQTKKKGEKPSEKVASGDGDGFETILLVGVGESTSLNMQRKSPMMSRTKSKVAGSKKKTSKAAPSTSEEPPIPESVGRNTHMNNW
jgi:hypothetical protein